MSAWRVLGVLAGLLAGAAAGPAQTYSLAEKAQAGDCFHYQLDMKLAGEMRINNQGQFVPLRLEAAASHRFTERVLVPGSGPVLDKTARVYETAQTAISVQGNRIERILRPERRLIVAQRHDDRFLVYAPAGPLQREELDLTAGHFDTLSLAGLLPGKEVAVGDTWKIGNSAAQALCNFEGLTEQSLTGKLEAIRDQTALVRVTGKAVGIDAGAMVKLDIEATARFDLAGKRLVGVEWKQQDDRDQGPVSPATRVELTTVLSRKACEQPEALSDVALVSVPDTFEPPVPLTQLDIRDPKRRFDLLYARDWHVVARTEERLVMRLLDRGDFVAQVSITPWAAAARGEHLAPEEFKKAMTSLPGWEPERELQAGEVPGEGRYVYRLSLLGTLEGIQVVQNFYLVASPGGEQVILSFTMTPKQVDKLGARDLTLVGSLEVPASAK